MLSLAIPYISQRQNVGYSVILDSPHSASSTTQQIYSSSSSSSDINRQSAMNSYPSSSPSPPQIEPAHLLDNNSPVDSHNSFLHSALPNYTPEESLPQQDRESNKYGATSTHTNPLPLNRRMSEPAALSGTALYATPSLGDSSNSSRYIQHPDNPFAFDPHALPPSRHSALYPGHLHRGVSTGSLRDLRHHHTEYPPTASQQQSEWKQDNPQLSALHQNLADNRGDGFDEPISPLQPNFSGALGSPTSGMPYSPGDEHPYGPSPPGTGTSTSSSIAPLSAGPGLACSPSLSINHHLHRSLSSPNVGADLTSVDRKTYSFVALPGNAVKKRPRRRYDEIERLYQCSWPDCSKSYGTLNHLNAHVTMQKHGPKRTPDEFKEMRKQWRKAKKEHAAAAVAMRRDSYADLYDDHAGYDPRYLAHHSHHHSSRGHSVHDGLGLASSVTIGMSDRYTVPVDDIRYPPSHERDDGSGVSGVYDPAPTRQRYMNGSSSWHGGSALSRSNLMHHQQRQQHDAYGSASGMGHQEQPAHHSQLPQLSISSRLQSSSPHSAPPHSHPHDPNSAMHGARGLPQNSTLLTPLSGYHSSSLVPSMPSGGGGGNVMYTSEGYELYDSDSTGRPGTGHTNFSISQASVDEFDPHSH